MIRFTTGNLLDASTDALVNTVNEIGVMGKGIALMFKERFRENTRAYTEASKRNEVRVGRMLVTETGEFFPKWIINFPTKKHWRNPSQLVWVQEGLKDLVRVIREKRIRSVALPPLGCGNGGLAWSDVRPLIESTLAELTDVDVVVYEPTNAYQNSPKRTGMEKLTPARALVAELVRRYSVLGLDCTMLEIQKLAYFLQRRIVSLGLSNPLDLRFIADKFGPYADNLRHLLDGLDGSYLHADKRVSDASPMDLIWFDNTRRSSVGDYLVGSDASAYLPALEQTTRLIDGFESPLGMELLATVDWLLTEQHVAPTVAALRVGLTQWPAGNAAVRRKVETFDDRLLDLALTRLSLTTN